MSIKLNIPWQFSFSHKKISGKTDPKNVDLELKVVKIDKQIIILLLFSRFIISLLTTQYVKRILQVALAIRGFAIRGLYYSEYRGKPVLCLWTWS